MPEAAMNPPVLEARALRKSYRSGGQSLLVLAGVDLVVPAGESVSIRGESGSGKSTLLHLLAGLDQPDAGTISWQGTPVLITGGAEDLALRRRTYLGMIFQSFHLVPELDALENLLLAARIAGMNRPQALARARGLLQRVGLDDRRDHLPRQLSGGESQRVAVARALMNSPRLVLADEPTGNLDEKSGTGVIDLILGLCAENAAAVVLATHNPHHAARTMRQLTLGGGRLGD
jgi:predicted ABC-type transport system involved in lysophospholipase L1 biosynthesis ATPase subunit